MSQFYPIDSDHDDGRAATMKMPREDSVDVGLTVLEKIDLLLRGRYVLTAVLCVMLSGLCGVGAYLAVTPKYTNRGIISIKPVLEHVLYKTENSSMLPMFDAFVGSQVEFMRSQRVLEMAQQAETWKTLGRGLSPEEQAEFAENLQITRPPNSQLILVAFTDPNPTAAQVAVKNVIEAYMRIFGERDALIDNERLRVLEQERTRHTSELRTNRQRQMERSNYLGYEALSNQYQFKIEQLNQIQQQLNEAKLARAASGQTRDASRPPSQGGSDPVAPTDGPVSPPMDDPTSQSSPEGVAVSNKEMDLAQLSTGALSHAGTQTFVDQQVLSPEEIALTDPQMQTLLHQKNSVEAELQTLRLRFGERHPKVIQATTSLGSIKQAIEDRVSIYHQLTINNNLTEQSGSLQTLSEKDLQILISRLQTVYDSSVEETQELGRRKLELENLEEEAKVIRSRLDMTLSRIEQLNVESRMRGRIETITDGQAPETPVNQGKRKQMAVLGAIGGGGLGAVIMLLTGKLDRRLYSSAHAQVTVGEVRLLSVLPIIPQDLSDAENALIAGQSVHHIRSMLQVSSKQGSRKIFAVTSPASGTGKTSLTAALGLSFAGSKSRTLLIDCDLAGGGLSRRLGNVVRASIGMILLQRGCLGDDQLLAAEHAANMTGTTVDQVLLNRGQITQADYDAAVAMQNNSPLGLMDALEGEALDRCIGKTGIENLSILPIGSATSSDISRVSPDALKQLIEQTRQRYDAVLIDTGPVPGSLEAAMVAAAADGVILIVSRGEQEPSARGALTFLQSYGARIEGLVFNRARQWDITRSAFSSSVSRSTRRSGAKPAMPVEMSADATSRTERFGPVAQAVAATSRVFVSDEDIS